MFVHSSWETRGFRVWFGDFLCIEGASGQSPAIEYQDNCQGDDYDASFHIALGLGIWVSVRSPWLRRSDRSKFPYETMEVSLKFHNGSIWWNLWTPSDLWRSSTPRWRNGNFSVEDFILGPSKCSEETIASMIRGHLQMPEGRYDIGARLFESSYKRPRWWAQSVSRVTVEVINDSGVPVPGKGTASYNCGDDAYHGSTFPSNSIEEAIAKFKADILNTRRNRGGIGWFPSKGWPKGLSKCQ